MAHGTVSLTCEQKVAVACEENVLLRACPGSGKTRVIIAKLAREIEAIRGTPRTVACITYTNSAVYEMEPRLEASLQVGDEQYFEVSTIHSFCLNHIFRPFCWHIPAYSGGFKVLTRDMEECEPLVNSVCDNLNYLRPSCQDYEDFAALNIDVNGNAIGAALINSIVARGAKLFWQRCRERGYIDFCSILYYSLRIVSEHPEIADGLASRYAWILVDEFQDTTDLQVEILGVIAARGRTKFFLVGDGYQSIFGFAGARPELADVFAGRIGARCDLSLSGNFRSSPPIIEHAEQLFARQPPMTSVGHARFFTEAPQYHVVADPFHAITDFFLPMIQNLGIPVGEATILAPTWTPLFPLSRRLREFGVSVVGPGARPYRRSRLFAALAEQLCGCISDPAPDSVPGIERALFHTILDLTGRPRFEIFTYQGRLVVMALLEEARRLAAANEGAVHWLAEASQAMGVILASSDFIAPSHAPGFYASAQEMKADMRQNRVDAANLSIADLGLFASPRRALKLSTLHFSKGREFDAVAMIRLHEGAIPDFRLQTAEEIAGAKRLFYVGVTRARRILMYISDTSDRRNRPSRFLGRQGVQIVV